MPTGTLQETTGCCWFNLLITMVEKEYLKPRTRQFLWRGITSRVHQLKYVNHWKISSNHCVVNPKIIWRYREISKVTPIFWGMIFRAERAHFGGYRKQHIMMSNGCPSRCLCIQWTICLFCCENIGTRVLTHTHMYIYIYMYIYMYIYIYVWPFDFNLMWMSLWC